MKDNNETLAMEMLSELKKASRRNFILAIVLLIALVLSNLAWLIYESQFETITEATQTIENTDGDNTSYNQEIGE